MFRKKLRDRRGEMQVKLTLWPNIIRKFANSDMIYLRVIKKSE